MTAMDRDELEEIIRRVIAEDRAEQLAHPSRREKVTQFTDPQGNTWISRTLSKAEELRRMTLLVGFVCSVFIGAGSILYKYVLLPEFQHVVSSQIEEHSMRARRQMETVTPTIVSRSEFDRRAATDDARWAAQDDTNDALQAWMVRVEAKLDRLIERR